VLAPPIPRSSAEVGTGPVTDVPGMVELIVKTQL